MKRIECIITNDWFYYCEEINKTYRATGSTKEEAFDWIKNKLLKLGIDITIEDIKPFKLVVFPECC